MSPGIDYIDDAIRQRLAVIAKRGQRLMADGVPTLAPAARELARDWHALMVRTVGQDTALGDRLVAAYENEPLLQAGLAFTPALRNYIEQAAGP